ncbi:MAG: MATE family efflux transporter [Candidatus Aenigmarchaeota archaeon]|nr:MATE family efflux transporter [Candidatus Aenigmarchaeota archaeon]
MTKPDIINGDITKTLLKLSWPMTIGLLMQTSFNIIDTIFVGRIGPDALAAVSMTFPIIFLFIALAGGISIGTVALVSKNIGANKKDDAGHAAEQSLLLSFVMGVSFAILGFIFTKPLFYAIGAGETLVPIILSYMYPIYIGILFMFLAFASNSILRGLGDMKTPMKTMILATTLNIVLDWILIFGFGPIQAMGVPGAAWATVIARFVAFAYIFSHLLFRQNLIILKLKHLMPNAAVIKKIFTVGIPASLSNIAMSISMLFMLRIVSVFGPNAIASYGLAFRIDSIAFMMVFGIASAVITFVGQNTGAKKMSRAIKATWSAAKITVLIMGFLGILFFVLRQRIAAVFTDDVEIIRMTAQYLKIVSPTFVFMAIGLITLSSFQGMGNGMPQLVMTIMRLFVVMVPLSYILSIVLGMGLTGVWYAVAISSILTGIVSGIWFKKATKTERCA